MFLRVEYFFFQAEDGIRDLVRSRGLGDVYKRQAVWGLLGTFSPALPLSRSEIESYGIAFDNERYLHLSLIHI